MNQRLNQIYSDFTSRPDHVMWDLVLTPKDDNQIQITMETNEAYIRGRDYVNKIVLDKLIDIDDEDHITEPHIIEL